MRIRLNLPDPLAARVAVFAARAGLDMTSAYVFLIVDGLRHDGGPPFREVLSQALAEAGAAQVGPALASPGHAAPAVRATSPVLPEPPADVAEALRTALASLPLGVARIPDALFLLDEVGIEATTAHVAAAERVLREAGWREDSEGWGR